MAKDKATLKLRPRMVKSVQIKQTKSVSIKELICFQLAKILKLKRHFIDLQMKKLGFSRSQWQVLLWLKILGNCSQKELLKNLDIDAAHLTRILEGFEKNKYIIRISIEGDRRALFIQITDYSKQKLLPHLEVALIKENTILLDGLSTEDKKCLKNLLQKLEKNMESALKIK